MVNNTSNNDLLDWSIVSDETRPEDTPDSDAVVSVAIIGVGPTGLSFLERLAANVSEFLVDVPVVVHLIDPHPIGTGRIWRPTQSSLLWMNSMAEDVTMFTDGTVACAGPIRPGPSLIEWARSVDPAREFATPALTDEIRTLTGMSFPTRVVQSEYLEFFRRQIIEALPRNVTIVVHASTAVDIVEGIDQRQTVVLGNGDQIDVDAAILTLGHLDALHDPGEAAMAEFADRHGLFHLAPAHTADADFSALRPGTDVILRGFGLAFIDLIVVLTEGRGGRYDARPDGALDYVASGREPVFHVGSHRGVPYHAKLGYRLQGTLPRGLRFFTSKRVDEIIARGDALDFRIDLWPLVAKEIGWWYYHELFTAHPDATQMSFDDFSTRYADVEWDSADCTALIAAAVPHADDRLDFGALDEPFAGARFGSADHVEDAMRRYIEADLVRRNDPRFSADLGMFYALLQTFGQIARINGAGLFTARSKVEDVDGWWFGFFSYYASGPPAPRLQQLLALSRAGIVHFLGPDLWVQADEASGRFRAGGSATDHITEASGLIEARNARPSVSRSADPLVATLFARGEVSEEVLVDPRDGACFNPGRLVVTPNDMVVVDRDGAANPRRRALGTNTSRPAAGAFARPRTNAPAFRQNDFVARDLLGLLAELAEQRADRGRAPAASIQIGWQR